MAVFHQLHKSHPGNFPMVNPSQSLPGEKLHILIVEDSNTQALKLDHLLQFNGYRTTITANGREAMEFMATTLPDLVITDVVMPEVNGYELCRRIKADPRFRKIPVMLLTTLAEVEDIIKGLESGANNFIIEPYDDKVLLSVVEDMADNPGGDQEEDDAKACEVQLRGKKHRLSTQKNQIFNMLLSAFENMLQKSRELEETNRRLTEAAETIKTLQCLIPICAKCKSIRDDDGYWERVEVYIGKFSEVEFTHSICPKCAEELYPEFYPKR